MRLLCVIVNYCSADLTLGALDAVVPQLGANGSASAWVVDNASPDHSLQTLRAGIAQRGWTSPVVCVLSSAHNNGYGAGNNLAIRRALSGDDPPDYIYLLNPDAAPDPGAVCTALSLLDANPGVGVLGTRLRDEAGRHSCCAFRFPSLLSELESGLGLGVVSDLLRAHTVRMPAAIASGPVNWVTGASMMLRRRMLEQIGLFDETFFLYFEETDLCRRAADAGWLVYFLRESSVFHVGGAVTGVGDEGRRPAYWYESRRHYLRKHHGASYLYVANAIWLTGFVSQRLRRFVLGRKAVSPPHRITDFLRYSFSPAGEGVAKGRASMSISDEPLRDWSPSGVAFRCDEEPGFLEHGGDRLYVVRHPAVGKKAGHVLLAGPFANERTHASALWTRWARYLAEHGLEVLRFDYRGIGESTGSFHRMSCSEWLSDIVACYRHIKEGAAALPIALHGLRLGALLLSHLFDSGEGAALLMWEPMASAEAMLRAGLRSRLATDMAAAPERPRTTRDQYVAKMRAGELVNVDGFCWSKMLWDDATKYELKIPEAADRRPWRVFHLSETSRTVAPENSEVVVVPKPPFWKQNPWLNPDVGLLFERSSQWLREAMRPSGAT